MLDDAMTDGQLVALTIVVLALLVLWGYWPRIHVMWLEHDERDKARRMRKQNPNPDK